MSVYKPKGRKTYVYDFEIEGNRYHGNTGCTTEREALAHEKRERAKALKELEEFKRLGRMPMVFKLAVSRYWEEVGQHLRADGPDNCLWSLEWLQREIGPEKRIRDIDNALVARLVGKRRADKGRMSGKLVAPATVNRSVTEPLRKILNRAASMWGEQVQRIDWKKHLLKEPKERVRELRQDEEQRLFEKLREDYHPILRFAIMTGVRLGEVYQLRWKDIDWGARTIMIHGKGGKVAPIPLPPSVRELLWELQGHHEEFVFTYVAQRARDGRRRGQRYPITREGLKSAFRRVLPKANIEDYRFHDNRHTTATRLLRKKGNLKVVQRLLRHENIETTMRYAHVMHDDVLEAMEETIQATESAKIEAVTESPSNFPSGQDQAGLNFERLKQLRKLKT